MSAVGSLHLVLLVAIAIAGAAAMCGFIASAVMLRNKRRARGYFILGVLTGWMAAAITHARHAKLSTFGALRVTSSVLREPVSVEQLAVQLVSRSLSRQHNFDRA